MTSSDGITWTAGTCPAKNWITVIWAGSQFVALAYNGSGASDVVMTSPDGITWTLQDFGVGSWGAGAVCGSTGLAYAPSLAMIATVYRTSSGGPFGVLTSPDGVTWTNRTMPGGDAATILAGIAWNASLGKFVIAGQNNPERILYSSNGVTWLSQNPDPDGVLSAVWDVVAAGANLFVISDQSAHDIILVGRP